MKQLTGNALLLFVSIPILWHIIFCLLLSGVFLCDYITLVYIALCSAVNEFIIVLLKCCADEGFAILHEE